MAVDETGFEMFITDWLVTNGGWDAVKVGNHAGEPGRPGDFDPVLGLDTAELFAFIGTTQGTAWNKLRDLHGGDADTAIRRLDATVELDDIERDKYRASHWG